MVNYQQYGISPELVEHAKARLKQPDVKERVKPLVRHLTRADLQNRTKVRSLLRQIANIADISLSQEQAEAIVRFVISQNIDPQNRLHLLRLWGMFR